MGGHREKCYFLGFIRGQDFAVFKDSLDKILGTEGYSSDAEICPDSIDEDRTIIIGGESFAIYNAESTETTKTFTGNKLSGRKLKVSVIYRI